MNERYSEVIEHLRRQHAMNTQEIRIKYIDNSGINRYYEYDGIAYDKEQETTSNVFLLKTKIFLFLCSFLLFACYLYGGQDMKKGAAMTWNTIHMQIAKLEEERPAVKQATGYLKNVYYEVKHFANTYIETEEQ